MAVRPLLASLLIAIALAGCDKSNTTSAPPAPTGTVVQAGPLEILGVVKYTGPAIVVKEIDNSLCVKAARITDESVVVSSAGGLKNTVVYLDRKISGLPVSSATPAVLDQHDCRFVPHVLAVAVGQALTVKNGDSEIHNVHADPSENPSFNFATPPGNQQSTSFKIAEFIRVKCDVHPWMASYVAVLNSSFFAVTDDDGQFDLKGLPPGQYEVTAWHERFGELKQSIDLKDGSAPMTFVYQPPAQ